MDTPFEELGSVLGVENVPFDQEVLERTGDCSPRLNVAVQTALEIADLGFDRAADSHLARPLPFAGVPDLRAPATDVHD